MAKTTKICDFFRPKIKPFGRSLIQMQQGEEREYVLKNLQYDPVHRLDLFLLPCSDQELEGYLRKLRRDGSAIEPKRPWQLQVAILI